MAIRNEGTSTTELLRDSRYHRASLMADKTAKDLAPAVKTTETELRAKRDAREEADDQRAEHLAVLIRVDFDLDQEVTQTELEVYGAVKKDRKAPGYRACFAKGLTFIVAMRGDDEARAVDTLVKALTTYFPDIAKKRGKGLLALAKAGVDAETEWKDSETAAGVAGAEEVIARVGLVRQLQKNEGALVSLYPGQKARVRSYFRATRAAKAAKSAVKPGAPA